MIPEGGWAHSCLRFPSHPFSFSRGREPYVPRTRRRVWRVGAGQETPEGVREENQRGPSLPEDRPLTSSHLWAAGGPHPVNNSC